MAVSFLSDVVVWATNVLSASASQTTHSKWKMDTKNMGKKIFSVAIFIAIIVAVWWLAQKHFKDFGETVVTQTRQHILSTARAKGRSVEDVVLDIRDKPEILSQDQQIRRAVIRNTLIILSAAIILGCFFSRIISGCVVRLQDTVVKARKSRLDSKRFDKLLERKVQERTSELSSAMAKLEKEVAQRSLPQRSLQQRIKHLNCLYGLSKVVEQPKISLEQIFPKTVCLIRNAYQYPDVTCVRITFDGIHYKTDGFEKSELSQYAQIKARGDKAGVIEVYYLGEKTESGGGPFLREERDLLDAVAERLGRITELKQAGEKLQLFRNLIDRSNDCIFIIEPKWGRLLYVNERACETLGYTQEELLDMTFKDIEESVSDDLSWQDYIKGLELEADAIKQGKHRRKDATTFFVETSLKQVSQGKRDYIIAVARDITERKQAEEEQGKLIRELKSTNEKVKSINQELKDFAYVVSHDLKAPLRGIKTLADWLSADYGDKLDAEGKEQMDLLLARVGRMHCLIDGVLEYSRVGRVKEKQIQVDLNELVSNVIDMVAPLQNIAITIESELPVVECERTRIMQVFENLLSNAVKYMDKPEGRVGISCVEENGFWKFCVADNGPGIEERHFDRIFRIFQTLSPRDEFESTGIGLTVIKKIVTLYGGKVWVKSKVGEGSKFFFTLPKQKEGVKYAKLEANTSC